MGDDFSISKQKIGPSLPSSVSEQKRVQNTANNIAPVVPHMDTNPVVITSDFSGTNSVSATSSSVNGSEYFNNIQNRLEPLDAGLQDGLEGLQTGNLLEDLDSLSPEQRELASSTINNAIEYNQIVANQPYAEKFAIGMSEILQLINELRRTMGKTYHTDMENQRTNLMKQYDAKVDLMLEAAENDYAASMARGAGQIAAGSVGWIPLVGGGSQGFTGIGEMVGGSYQYKADTARADVAAMEGAIANSQSIHDQFGKYYDDLKAMLNDMRGNIEKTIQDSESSKQGITRNI